MILDNLVFIVPPHQGASNKSFWRCFLFRQLLPILSNALLTFDLPLPRGEMLVTF